MYEKYKNEREEKQMRKFLTITFITVLILLGMSINVQAAEVTTWEGLIDELANGTDQEVTLSGDIIVPDTQTLNLNGKTLKLNNSLVVDAGNLTITGNGTISSETVSPLIRVNTGSTLNLENGTYSSTKAAGTAIRITGSTSTDGKPETVVTVGEKAKVSANYGIVIAHNNKVAYGVEVNVYGTIEAITENNGYNQGSMAITTNGYIKEPTTEGADVAEINIYNTAKLTAAEGNSGNMNNDDAPAIYAAGYAVWNIFGGYIEGSEALSIKGGEFYITGGKLKGTGKFNPEPDAYNNGSEATGSAISITENKGYAGNIVLEVSNAEVTSENGYAVFETITAAALQPAINEMTIISGNYTGKEGAVKAETQTNFIEGGTFSEELEKEYLSDTSEKVTNEDGTILVGTKHAIKIEEMTNGTVTSSLAEAIKGQTVELTVTPKDGYKLKSLKVLTVADSEVKVEDGKFIMPDIGVIVTAEFEEAQAIAKEEAIQQPEEKDNTPKTGAINIPSYVWISLAVIALVGIATTKKPGKHVK